MMNRIRIRIVGVLVLVNFCNPCVFSQTSVKISPDKRQQTIEGWGASLCWWAHMVGQWEDEEAIDRIVDSITSPEGLNMNIFRYNIGGGDDPSHYTTDSKNGHMVGGKGLRAEMEGFKASETSPYNWEADAGQRKIMLKIKEKRPDAIFEAFSNSPPYWMTYSGCASGNYDGGKDNLKPEYYDQFCDYLVDVCKFYKDSFGIEFKTLEPFNESATNFWYAYGSQEGCHFDVSTQISIIKLLYPKLKDAGLNTIISASDETNLGVFINVLNGYMADGDVMDLIGQFNTHTYSGSDSERKIIKDMTWQFNKPFWQSETGPLGYPQDNPFLNNLQLSQKLIADVKIMKPDAWLDWQLFEELNDVWCIYRGSFADETYRANKNFYVRMQFSRFIKQGYTIIESTDGNTLAAVNPANTELVLVAINTSDSPRSFQFDLSSFLSVSATTELYRTSPAEDCKKLSGPAVNSKSLSYTAPAYSASTFIVSAMYDDYKDLAIINGITFENNKTDGFVTGEKTVINNTTTDQLNNSTKALLMNDELVYQLENTLIVSDETKYLHIMTYSSDATSVTTSTNTGNEITLGATNVWKDQVITLNAGDTIFDLKLINGNEGQELVVDNICINNNPNERKVVETSPEYGFETLEGTPEYVFSGRSDQVDKPKIISNDYKRIINRSEQVLNWGVPPVADQTIPEDTLTISFQTPLQLSENTQYMHFMTFATTTQMKLMINDNEEPISLEMSPETWVDHVIDISEMLGGLIYKIKLIPLGSERYSTQLLLDNIKFNNDPEPLAYNYETPVNATYMIYSRNSNNVLMAKTDGTIIQDIPNAGSEYQQWEFEQHGNNYAIRCKKDKKLITDMGTYFLKLTKRAPELDGQLFSVVTEEEEYIRITSLKTSKSVDVEGASTGSGAKIGLWDYGTSGNYHRQWYLIKVADTIDNINTTDIIEIKANHNHNNNTFLESGINELAIHQLPGNTMVNICTIEGKQVKTIQALENELAVFLPQGVYIVTIKSHDTVKSLKGVVW